MGHDLAALPCKKKVEHNWTSRAQWSTWPLQVLHQSTAWRSPGQIETMFFRLLPQPHNISHRITPHHNESQRITPHHNPSQPITNVISQKWWKHDEMCILTMVGNIIWDKLHEARKASQGVGIWGICIYCAVKNLSLSGTLAFLAINVPMQQANSKSCTLSHRNHRAESIVFFWIMIELAESDEST